MLLIIWKDILFLFILFDHRKFTESGDKRLVFWGKCDMRYKCDINPGRYNFKPTLNLIKIWFVSNKYNQYNYMLFEKYMLKQYNYDNFLLKHNCLFRIVISIGIVFKNINHNDTPWYLNM